MHCAARIFQWLGGGGHTVSNREYLPDSHFDVQALFYMCINHLALKWREGFSD